MPKARILAIDDQLYFRSYVQGLLEEEGYAVCTADSGDACLELLESDGPFDLVLTDLVMPGIGGVEMVRQVKKRWPDQDVVVVTGVSDVRSAAEAVRAGAASYLIKPVDREDLVRSIETLLDQKRVRHEHARLVSENLACLGFLSVVERGLALLDHSRVDTVADALLELLCLEARAHAGALWVRAPGSDPPDLVLGAVRGMVRREEEPDRLQLSSKQLEGLCRGQLIHEPGAPNDTGPHLWVPAARDETLWAVARISEPVEGRFAPSARAASGKLGEFGAIAFVSAARAEELERSALRDSRTGLHTTTFLEEAVAREIHRGHRYARKFMLFCLELEEPLLGPDSEAGPRHAEAFEQLLRPTDVMASEGPGRFWVLVPEADPVGCLTIKRRLLEGLAPEVDMDWPLASGMAAFPVDGESFEELSIVARRRVEEDRQSLVRSLRLSPRHDLAATARRLQERLTPMPKGVVPDVLQFLLDQIALRPDARGLIFVAPGSERSTLQRSLLGIGPEAIGTQVFVASDGDTVPAVAAVTAIPLPGAISPEMTWIVCCGEVAPYLLVAGPPGDRDSRPVFHSDDRSLVEYVTQQLRVEAGLGGGEPCGL